MVLIAGVFLLIALATFFATMNWLRGWAAWIVYSLAGAGAIALLRIGNIPPKWFDGSLGNFGLAALLMAWSFAGKTPAENTFRIPFVFSFGFALFVVNVWAHV